MTVKGHLGDRFEWTQANTARAKKMWDDGNSPAQIAEMLGGGCTKNAVIGKRNRMGWEKRFENFGSRQPKENTPYRRLPDAPRFQVPPIPERPGWPTKAQLMGRRA
jgi:hypothetical protein